MSAKIWGGQTRTKGNPQFALTERLVIRLMSLDLYAALPGLNSSLNGSIQKSTIRMSLDFRGNFSSYHAGEVSMCGEILGELEASLWTPTYFRRSFLSPEK